MTNINGEDRDRLGFSIPVQVGKGKLEKGKDNKEEITTLPTMRNKKYGYFEIITEKTGEKETAKRLAERAKRKAAEKAGNNNEIIH